MHQTGFILVLDSLLELDMLHHVEPISLLEMLDGQPVF